MNRLQMIPGAEQIIADALGAAVTSAERGIAARIWVATGGRTHAKTKSAAAGVAARMSGAKGLAKGMGLSRVVAALPPGISVRQLESALEGPILEGLVSELIAARVAGVSSTRLQKIHDNFELSFVIAFPDVEPADSRSFGSAIFYQLDKVILDLVETIEGTESREALRQVALLRLTVATLEAIERHNELLSKSADRDSAQSCISWQHDYRQQIVNAHGYIEPPDFERKRKVPIDTLFVTPGITLLGEKPSDSRLIPDFMSAFDGTGQYRRKMSTPSALDRAVLLGDPGAGKSTCASVIACRTALQRDGVLPFFVTLRLYASQSEDELSILKYIERRIETYYQCPAPQGAVESALLSGKALVIFDGLDELVDTYQRRDMTNRVELFAARYPLARILITSRKVGYSQAQLDESVFWSYEISGFRDRQVEMYVSRWFRQGESLEQEQAENLAQAFMSESQSIPDLRANPLMLSLLCIIYRGQNYLPRNRPDVYERCATLLFDRWDSSRKIYVDLRARAHVDAAMKHLAYWIFTRESEDDGVTESELIAEAASYFAPAFDTAEESVRAAREFVDFCRGRAWVFSDAGTTADGEPLFKFTHRTFLEYFTAFELTRKTNGPEELARLLLPHVSRQEWDTVAQLAIQIANKASLSGAARALKFMLEAESDQPGWWNVMLFTTRCAEFLHVGPHLTRRVARNALVVGLREIMGSATRSAISVAFGNVLHALGNVLPELRSSVADELSKELVGRFNSSSESERRTSRELLYIFPVLTLENDGTEVMTFWKEWHASLFNNTIIRGSYPDARDWRAGLATGVLPLVAYLSESPLEAKMPLDKLWIPLSADFVDVSYPAPIDILLSMSWKWSSGARQDASIATTSMRGDRSIPEYLSIGDDLRQFGTYSASLGQPPWVSRNAVSYGRFNRFSLPQEIDDAVDPDVLWGLVLVALLASEATGLTRNSDLKRMGFLESVAAARTRSSGFDTTSFSQHASLDETRRELLGKWVRGEVDFISSTNSPE